MAEPKDFPAFIKFGLKLYNEHGRHQPQRMVFPTDEKLTWIGSGTPSSSEIETSLSQHLKSKGDQSPKLRFIGNAGRDSEYKQIDPKLLEQELNSLKEGKRFFIPWFYTWSDNGKANPTVELNQWTKRGELFFNPIDKEGFEKKHITNILKKGINSKAKLLYYFFVEE